ncbi:MAG: hypothetical protein E6I32_10120 [Chloroflexi bacterium]|nr:MAG: hypothetical protein E6I32_10120 [Chloroflexota bacterium]
MNRCQKCKNELAAEARFCNICGTPQVTSPWSMNPTRTIQPDIKHVHPGREHRADATKSSASPTYEQFPKADDKKALDNVGRPDSTWPSNAPLSTTPPAPVGSIIRPITPLPSIPRHPVFPKTTIEFATLKTSQLNEPPKSELIEHTATTPLPLPGENAAQTPPQQKQGIIRPIVTSSSLRQYTPAPSSQISKTPPNPQTPLPKPAVQQKPEAGMSDRPVEAARDFMPQMPLPTLAAPQKSKKSIPETPTIASPAQATPKTEPLQPERVSRPRPPQMPSPDLWMQQKQRLAEQRTKQEPAIPTQPLTSSAGENRRQESAIPTQPLTISAGENRRQELVGFNSTASSSQRLSWHDMPTRHLDHGITNDANGQGNGTYKQVDHQELALFSPESFAYTSKAAEHWRKSWRDRQYAEAGPAEAVSKGQASVPSPLMAMQNSFGRMRAIINKQKQDTSSSNLGFWVTLFLMICLIGGLGTYIVSTYLPNASFGAAHIAPPGASQQASLALEGTSSTTFMIGQALHVHGEHFGANDPIRILLDTTTPILSVQANDQGAFDTTLSISNNWPVGTRIIQAIDDRANMSAYLDIQVNPAASPVTSSPNLSVTLNGKAIQSLPFSYQIGQSAPEAQRITITNTSGKPLYWSAAASTDHNLNWLTIADNDIEGQLDISQPHSIGIGVNVTGLGSSPANKPYRGQITFTINSNEELTLPVQLTIIDAIPEMIFSPEPILAVANPDGTCQSGVTLTLWSVNPDLKDNIQFIDDRGNVKETGDLESSGTNGDTVILTLRCFAVQKGHPYSVQIFANSLQWHEMVIVQ